MNSEVVFGPTNLYRNDKRKSFCILKDNSISQRTYTPTSKTDKTSITHEGVSYQIKKFTTIPCTDITHAKKKLAELILHLRNNKKYSDQPAKIVLGKRTRADSPKAPADPSVSKRLRVRVEQTKEEKADKLVKSGPMDLMLAHTFDGTVDPKGWLMSEKLDGVRCYWNGARLYSRNGNAFQPPKWFIDELPKDIALDGELWTKRDDFQNAVGIVKKMDGKGDWSQIKYMVYDAPLINKSFKQRIKIAEEALAKNNSKYVVLHKQEVCKDQAHLDKAMDMVIQAKGEGMMIKDPNSKYEQRRSKALLKVKKFDDAEATVIGHLKGTGRCQDMTGAIQVKNDNGVVFKIGSGFTDAQRRSPPKKGARVTYKYQGLTKAGVPRFPIFMRIHPGV